MLCALKAHFDRVLWKILMTRSRLGIALHLIGGEDGAGKVCQFRSLSEVKQNRWNTVLLPTLDSFQVLVRITG